MHPTTGQAAALPAGAHFETGRAENLRPRRRGRRFVALLAAALSAAALMAPASHASVVEQTGDTCFKTSTDYLGHTTWILVQCPLTY